uniref:Putative ovule protein n=1 Tax=Solanum chacoense TaxID=4108 RepID=A0A0V0H107_SOLCH
MLYKRRRHGNHHYGRRRGNHHDGHIHRHPHQNHHSFHTHHQNPSVHHHQNRQNQLHLQNRLRHLLPDQDVFLLLVDRLPRSSIRDKSKAGKAEPIPIGKFQFRRNSSAFETFNFLPSEKCPVKIDFG